MVTDTVWGPSVTATTPALSATAILFGRTSSHTYTAASGPPPVRMQIDVDQNCTRPAWIPPEGKDDFWLFVNAPPMAAGFRGRPR